MSEEAKTITAETCAACGADVRPESLFCYNCGESLGAMASTTESVVEEKVNNAIEIGNGASNAALIKEGPGLRSAATVRKQGRSFQRGPIKIKWEPAEPPSDLLLIATTVGIFIFALLVVGLALYFK
jgi:hypothetical protein